MGNTYILNTSDYTFSRFSDGGFSGKILLAVPKNANLPKLLIKSEKPTSACNEFMYSRLAELLGIIVPKTYIMNVAQNDAHLFSSPYVVGVEFMEGMHGFSLEEMRSSALWRKEYAEQYALAAIFDQDDRVQLTMRADGHITGYDFTEAFWIADLGKTSIQLPGDLLTDILAGRLKAMIQRGFSMLSAGASVVKMHLELSEDAAIPADYITPMRKFLTISDDQVLELTDVLYEAYPVSIVVFFEEYIKALKKKLGTYIHSLEKAAK